MSDITIGELVTKLYEASHKMSRKNPHRALMLQAMHVLLQLSERIVKGTPEAEKPRVQLYQ